LNDDLRERTAALEASQEELLRQDSNREEFLASLGHELRNPLSAILSSLSLIQATDTRSTRALEILRRQAAHMTKLIDDLLDITRVKHGKIRLTRQTLDLTDWMPPFLDSVRQQVEGKGLTLECQLPPGPVTIDADPERLAQILQNLVRNAVNYTQAGSIAVSVRRDETATRISVRDTGVGIDPKDAAELFAPYRQGNENSENGGLGLGLAVVKALVEAHGGTVAVQSQGRGTGSEFSVVIPSSSATPVQDPVLDQEPLDFRRILVVDDQHDVANSLAAQLEDLGQDVEVAYNAAEGLAKARLHRPELAFVDLSMPDVSGTDLARQLRREFPAARLALIAMTGHGAAYAGARAEAFDQTLLKPITPQKLRHVLNGHPPPQEG